MTDLMFGALLEQSAKRPQDVIGHRGPDLADHRAAQPDEPAAAPAGRSGPHRRDPGHPQQRPVRVGHRHWGATDVGLDPRRGWPGAWPESPHEIPIWFGAYQPRPLRATGRLADGWIPSSPGMPPTAQTAADRIVDDAAESVGRPTTAIRRGYNIEGVFGSEPGFLRGSAKVWAEQLAELVVNERITAFFLYRVNDPDVLRRFAAEVAPAVRDLVA